MFKKQLLITFILFIFTFLISSPVTDPDNDAAESKYDLKSVDLIINDSILEFKIKFVNTASKRIFLFINADNNSSGYVTHNIKGVDYLIEGENIFSFTGTKSNEWSWNKIGTIDISTENNISIIKLDLTKFDIGLEGTIEYSLASFNVKFTPLDWLPDNTSISQEIVTVKTTVKSELSTSKTDYTDSKNDCDDAGSDFTKVDIQFDGSMLQITAVMNGNAAKTNTHLFLNSDNDENSGFSGSVRGIDFMVEGKLLYRFSGSNNKEWKWSQVDQVVSINKNKIIYYLPANTINVKEGSIIHFAFNSFDKNWKDLDYMPDQGSFKHNIVVTSKKKLTNSNTQKKYIQFDKYPPQKPIRDDILNQDWNPVKSNSPLYLNNIGLNKYHELKYLGTNNYLCNFKLYNPVTDKTIEPGKTEFLKNENSILQEISYPGEMIQTENVFTDKNDYVEIYTKITNLNKNRDKTISITFSISIDVLKGTWWDDIDHKRVITGQEIFINKITTGTPEIGLNSNVSYYPFSAITKNDIGLSIAVPLDFPRVNRIFYNPGEKTFNITFDIGLTKDTLKFPNVADFKFIVYNIEPEYGFRSTLEKYYSFYPEFFKRRLNEGGQWMPFEDISKINDFQDYFFRYHEINTWAYKFSEFDNKHDIIPFAYDEPWSFWISIKEPLPTRKLKHAYDRLNKIMKTGSKYEKMMASASVNNVIKNQYDKPIIKLTDAPWCKGAVIHLNNDPDIKTNKEYPYNRADATEYSINQYFNRVSSEKDGIYIDSVDGFSWFQNIDKKHINVADIPLTYNSILKKPVIFQALQNYEFTDRLRRNLEDLQKPFMCNWTLVWYYYFSHLYDLSGTEIGYESGVGPASHTGKNFYEEFAFKRSMLYQKPYAFLLCADFNKVDNRDLKDFFELCAFYGLFPGTFSDAGGSGNYWNHPEWYNRDRYIYLKYYPIILDLYQTGWQPITYVTSDNEEIFFQRFQDKNELYICMKNTNPKYANFFSIDIDTKKFGINNDIYLFSRFNGTFYPLKYDTKIKFDFALPKNRTEVFQIIPKDSDNVISFYKDRLDYFKNVIKKYREQEKFSDTVLNECLVLIKTLEDSVVSKDITSILESLSNLEKWITQNKSKNKNNELDFIWNNNIVPANQMLALELLNVDISILNDLAIARGTKKKIEINIENNGKQTIKLSDGTYVFNDKSDDISIKDNKVDNNNDISFNINIPYSFKEQSIHNVKIVLDINDYPISLQLPLFVKQWLKLSVPIDKFVTLKKKTKIEFVVHNKHSKTYNGKAIIEGFDNIKLDPSMIENISIKPGQKKRYSTVVEVEEMDKNIKDSINIILKDTENDKFSINKKVAFEFLPEGSSLVRTSYVKVIVDSCFVGGYTEKPLTDGVTNTQGVHWREAAWASGETHTPHFVLFEFNKPTKISEVIIWWSKEGNNYMTSKEYTVKYEKDGNWYDIITVKDNKERKNNKHEFDTISVDKLKIEQAIGGGYSARPDLMWLCEIEVF